jgi:hypothetical protein
MIQRTNFRFFATVFALFAFISMIDHAAATAQISKSVGLLKGEVTLSDGTPLPNVPVVIFRETERVTSTKSNSDGKVSSVLQPNATYRIAVNSSDYMYHEEMLHVPALDAYREFPLHIILTPLRNGQNFELPVPVFQPHARDIEPAAVPELDRIADEMKHNQKLSVSVVVYPDAPVKSKKDAAQKSLAAARETSMRSYFLGKNIPSSRFTVVSVTTAVPDGRFPLPASLMERARPAKRSGKKSKGSEPASSGLFPQYVEIMAHVAP